MEDHRNDIASLNAGDYSCEVRIHCIHHIASEDTEYYPQVKVAVDGDEGEYEDWDACMRSLWDLSQTPVKFYSYSDALKYLRENYGKIEQYYIVSK